MYIYVNEIILICRNYAGFSFTNYGTLHYGIGIFDITSGLKLSIEFVSNNYYNSLLPKLDNNYIWWNNTGSIVVTNPLNQSNWISSRLISSTTGVAYFALVNYLLSNYQNFNIFQPINVVYAPKGEINSYIYNSYGNIYSGASYIVKSTNSFYFVQNVINQLNSFTCTIQSFTQIYISEIGYIAATNLPATTISWPVNEPANPAVYNWYQALMSCYKQQYINSQGLGANVFLYSLSTCYKGPVAYIYKSQNSVYEINLYHSTTINNPSNNPFNTVTIETNNNSSSGNSNTNFTCTTTNYSVYNPPQTPYMQRYIYSLPPSQSVDSLPLTGIDITVLVFIGLGILIGIFFYFKLLIYKIIKKPNMMNNNIDDDISLMGVSDNFSSNHFTSSMPHDKDNNDSPHGYKKNKGTLTLGLVFF